MEKFDINKEMAKFKGLNIIEKCSALDDLLDDLEDAQEQIICAKDEISEEYANVFTKKFHEEIASFIAETFHVLKNMVIKSCMTTGSFI